MFLKKLFNFSKDYNYYMEKGDGYMTDERFADARDSFGEALERLEAIGNADPSLISSLRHKIAETGNRLGRLNLAEAEHAFSCGDKKKAGDHLRIVMDLADDKDLREKSEELMSRLDSAPPDAGPPKAAHSCNSCKGGEHEPVVGDHGMDGSLPMEDRLALYFHTLPEDLPERYAAMGEDFNRGCLLNLESDGEGALGIFEELSADRTNDILEYEKAIIYYHMGDAGKCEKLLNNALDLNQRNPLCYIGLVQLFTETGKPSAALPVVERMIEIDLIPEQARLMQGDLYTLLQDDSMAVESYSNLLSSPQFAREAVGRLVPLLEKQGRSEEAAYLAKKFAKGCC